MTFKETDFPGVFHFLKGFIKDDTDPVLVKDVVLQVLRMYDEVPLYPGIVSSCLFKLVKPVDPRQLAVGQRVTVRTHDGAGYTGTVSAVNGKGFTLSRAAQVAPAPEVKLDFAQLGAVQLVNDRVLEELWPSLVARKEIGR